MKSQSTQPGLRKDTLVSQIYECLRKRIANFSLKPGERIDVKALAQELSVSQTPVREALHKLVEQGLVNAKPYVGYFVTRLTPEDVKELFDLRKAIEILALKYIIMENCDEKSLDELRKCADKLAQQRDLETLSEEVRTFDEDFHVNFLIRGSHNKWLAKLGNGIIDLIRLTTQLSLNPKTACEEHRKILDAIARRDLKTAASLLDAHLERAKHDSIVGLPSNEGVVDNE